MNESPSGDVQVVVSAFCLAMTRVSGFVVASPMFGYQTVINSVKVGFCVVLSLFWLPAYIEHARVIEPTIFNWAMAIVYDFVSGLTLGFLVRLLMLPTRIAGTYLGQELGFNLGQVADPTSGTPSNEMGQLFDVLGLCIFWVTDIHHLILRTLGASIIQPAGRLETGWIAAMVSDLFAAAHEQGILIVSPVAATMFLVLVYLMVVMRSWPQVTLFSFGMAVRLILGLLLLAFLIPVVVANMARLFRHTASFLESLA